VTAPRRRLAPRTLDVRVSRDGVRPPVSDARVAAIAGRVLRAERATAAMVAITFVSRRRIAALNRRHLGHRGATDIVTLEHARPSPVAPVVGDIYIAPEVARQNARTHGVPVREEVARLVVHGVLHALGWTHDEGDERERSPMWRRQEALLRRLAVSGLI
jgi:probable rRNA maturation factor